MKGLITAIGLALLVISCKNSMAGVEVLFPQYPENWNIVSVSFPRKDCFLVYPDNSGGLVEETVSWDSGGLELPRTAKEIVPVLFYWHRRAKPAGGWYDPHVRRIALSWARGPLALVQAELIGCGYWPFDVNWARLQDSLERKGWPTPWALDAQRLMNDLLQYRVSGLSLKPLETRTVIIPVAEQVLYPADPFANPVWSRGGEAVIESHDAVTAVFFAGGGGVFVSLENGASLRFLE